MQTRNSESKNGQLTQFDTRDVAILQTIICPYDASMFRTRSSRPRTSSRKAIVAGEQFLTADVAFLQRSGNISMQDEACISQADPTVVPLLQSFSRAAFRKTLIYSVSAIPN